MRNNVGGKTNPFSAFFLHLHPRTVPAETIRFSLSFGLGGMAATLFFIMVCTGLLLLIQYSPTPQGAYLSVRQMYSPGVFGGFIRNIHHWAGNLLVIVASLHLLRVFFSGALSGMRRINWLLGIFVLLLVLFANFTGYLMPWDQLAYWAVTIFINMTSFIPLVGDWLADTLRGGREVGQTTLTTFFALHVGILPTLMVVLLLCHFWLIRKAGGLVQHERGRTERVPVIPHLISREAATAFTLLAILFIFAALVDAPLNEPANPGESPNPAKAAWYFMGLQELLLHLQPSVAICIVPVLVLLCLLAVPFIREGTLPEGIWFGGERGAKLALWTYFAAVLLTITAVYIDDIMLRTQSLTNGSHLLVSRGILPIFLVCLMQGGLYLGLRGLGGYSRAEGIMAVAVTFFAVMSGLTIVGIWFRGPGMQLFWPG